VLNDIINLIEKKDRLGADTYNDMIVKFLELCNESSIVINAVHLEIIIRNLIKDAQHPLLRPDYTQPKIDYKLMRLSESIMNSNSITTSISFERLKEQIYSAKTYQKNGTSPLDQFFV
jgi:hypothetical protein